jgi:hypothetical protein
MQGSAQIKPSYRLKAGISTRSFWVFILDSNAKSLTSWCTVDEFITLSWIGHIRVCMICRLALRWIAALEKHNATLFAILCFQHNLFGLNNFQTEIFNRNMIVPHSWSFHSAKFVGFYHIVQISYSPVLQELRRKGNAKCLYRRNLNCISDSNRELQFRHESRAAANENCQEGLRHPLFVS